MINKPFDSGIAGSDQRAKNDNYYHRVDRMPLLAFELEPDGTIHFINRAVTRVTGYQADELLWRNWGDVLLPGKQRQQLKLLYRQFQSGDVDDYPLVITTRDDLVIILALNSANEYEPTGALQKIVVFAVDVTEPRPREEVVRRYQRIMSATVDAIALVDQNYVYQIINQPYLTWTGQSYDQIVGHSVMAVLGQTVFETVMKSHLDQALAGETSQSQGWFESETLGRKFLDASYAPYIEADDTISGVVVSLHDMTELKGLEDDLLQMQKTEAVGQLAAGVAHHYNNMLTVIMGFVGLALSQLPSDHPVAADLQRVLVTTRRAADLTRQMLAFARKQIIEPQNINLNELILTTSNLLTQLIPESITFTPILFPHLWRVKMDANQFEQVLVNLVVNARDAMPAGGKLTLATANTHLAPAEASRYGLSPGDYILLTVTDTGHGMTDAVKARVFEPFFTTKEVGHGTGLGLATCFGVVKRHQGHITVESQVDRGATFKVYLPRLVDPPAPAQPEQPTDLPRGTETILLVEDEPDVRQLVARVLRQQGYTIFEAEDGTAALEVVASQSEKPFDLLITDKIMPYLDGESLARRLKTIYPDLNVLFITGYPDETGSSSLLLKPFTPAVLIQKVRAVLDRPAIQPTQNHRQFYQERRDLWEELHKLFDELRSLYGALHDSYQTRAHLLRSSEQLSDSSSRRLAVEERIHLARVRMVHIQQQIQLVRRRLDELRKSNKD